MLESTLNTLLVVLENMTPIQFGIGLCVLVIFFFGKMLFVK